MLVLTAGREAQLLKGREKELVRIMDVNSFPVVTSVTI